MNLIAVIIIPVVISIPRVSGDEPTLLTVRKRTARYSPRERG